MSDAERTSEPAASPLDDLDFETAWRRVKWDLDNRTFVTFAYERSLIDSAFEEWVGDLSGEVSGGTFNASPCETCEVPKPGYHIRPGARLNVRDHLVYTALVQEIYELIRQHIETDKSRKDYSYLLRADGSVPWFQQPPFRGWSAFRKGSLDRIERDPDGITILTDVSGYYENIDLGRLRYVLQTIRAPNEILDVLFRCLNVWAEPRSRGIPQGISASDLLAKVYLDGVDRRLERAEIEHIRYVDDPAPVSRTVCFLDDHAALAAGVYRRS